MLNMIKAELYKTGRRAYPKIFLLVVLGGIVGLNLLIVFYQRPCGEKVTERRNADDVSCMSCGRYVSGDYYGGYGIFR